MKIISPQRDKMHYFFGYYDLMPYNSDGRLHLAHRVSFMDRRPLPEDICEIGYINLENNSFNKIAETTAWNFQQGALLQWFDDENIIYNARRGNEFTSVIKSIVDGTENELWRYKKALTRCKVPVCANMPMTR